MLNTSYTITADIDVPQGGGDGVIVGEGGRFFGYALYLLKGKPVFTYNLLDLKRTRWAGTERWPPAGIRSTTTSSTMGLARRRWLTIISAVSAAAARVR